MKQAKCHPNKKLLAKGLCSKCYAKKWYLKNKLDQNKRSKLWYKQNKKRHIERQVWRRYGITIKDILRLQKQQNEKCKLCLKKTRLICDHDHTTNRFRGLICYPCNTFMGKFDKDKTIIKRIIIYASQSSR